MGLLRLKDTKLPQTKRDEVFVSIQTSKPLRQAQTDRDEVLCINSNIKTPQNDRPHIHQNQQNTQQINYSTKKQKNFQKKGNFFGEKYLIYM